MENEEQKVENSMNSENTMDTSFVEEKKKKGVIRIIFNIFFTIVILVILGNAGLAVYNFNQLSNQKEAIVFTDMVEEKTEDKTTKTYAQGLFKIIFEQDSKGEKWTLKPFFLN